MFVNLRHIDSPLRVGFKNRLL